MNDYTSISVSRATSADADWLREFLLDTIVQRAYREGAFTLSSGQSSDYYINGKQVTLTAEGAVAIARLLLPRLAADTQAVAGLTLGADPIVSAVSVVSVYEGRPLPGAIVRKEAKGHGTQAYIEGPLSPGMKVAVLEDVVTTGHSALRAVEHLRMAGYTVEQVLAIVDRGQGGAELYREYGLHFEFLFSLAQIRDRARQLSDR